MNSWIISLCGFRYYQNREFFKYLNNFYKRPFCLPQTTISTFVSAGKDISININVRNHLNQPKGEGFMSLKDLSLVIPLYCWWSAVSILGGWWFSVKEAHGKISLVTALRNLSHLYTLVLSTGYIWVAYGKCLINIVWFSQLTLIEFSTDNSVRFHRHRSSFDRHTCLIKIISGKIKENQNTADTFSHGFILETLRRAKLSNFTQFAFSLLTIQIIHYRR